MKRIKPKHLPPPLKHAIQFRQSGFQLYLDKQKEKLKKNYIQILRPLGFYNKANLFPVP